MTRFLFRDDGDAPHLEPTMTHVNLDRSQATVLVAEERTLTVGELTQLVRYLNRHCEEQDNKMRQLKSEIGRLARRG